MRNMININLFLSVSNTVGDEPRILNIFMILGYLINVLKILIPVFLIMTSFISLGKALFNKDKISSEIISRLITKIAIGLLIFFVPSLIKSSYTLINSNIEGNLKNNFTKCFDNPTSCADMIKGLKELEEKSVKEKTDYIAKIKESAKKKIEEKALEDGKKVNIPTPPSMPITSNNPNNKVGTYGDAEDPPTGTIVGQKYNLTEEQLKFLAMIAQKEQGSLAGTKAEASLMANLFESKSDKYRKKFGTGGKGLYNYVLNSGWFSNTKKYLNNYSKLKQSSIDAVRDVLVGGNRTLPPYVTNHYFRNCYGVCFNNIKGDICKLVLDGNTYETINDIMNNSLYRKDKTQIYSRYGKGRSYWIFYSFPAPNSDPFGYYEGNYRRYKNSQN